MPYIPIAKARGFTAGFGKKKAGLFVPSVFLLNLVAFHNFRKIRPIFNFERSNITNAFSEPFNS